MVSYEHQRQTSLTTKWKFCETSSITWTPFVNKCDIGHADDHIDPFVIMRVEAIKLIIVFHVSVFFPLHYSIILISSDLINPVIKIRSTFEIELTSHLLARVVRRCRSGKITGFIQTTRNINYWLLPYAEAVRTAVISQKI